MITSRGALDELEASAVPAELVAAARHVHAASFYLQPRLAQGLRGLFESAHAAGATTSLDLNWDPAECWQGGLTEVLPVVDILFVNAAEAAGVSGAGDPTVAATVLAARVPLPVVKLGSNGALAHDGCRLVHVDALAVDVADTVGAGDSLDAGFLCGRLSGWDVGRSLALGVVCGSLSTRSAGGVDAQPSRAEAEAAMQGLLPAPGVPEECGR
jgi:sugar/nucleoside kinase (ribokinase family)